MHPQSVSVSPSDVTGIAVGLLAGSEALSLLPNTKANGWIQLALAALRGIAAAQTPDKRNRG